MAYNIKHTNGVLFATVPDGTTNTNSSQVIVGKNYAGYGEFLGENFLHLLENGANSTPPVNAVAGQLWFDSTANVLKVWNGINFKNLGSASSDPTPPLNPVIGDLWFDPISNQLKVYTSNPSPNQWLVIGPSFVPGTGESGSIVDIITDVNSVNHTIVKLIIEDEIVGIISNDAPFNMPAGAIPGYTRVDPGITLATSVSGGQPTFTGIATESLKSGSADVLTDTSGDKSFADIATLLSAKVNKIGDTMTGSLTLSSTEPKLQFTDTNDSEYGYIHKYSTGNSLRVVLGAGALNAGTATEVFSLSNATGVGKFVFGASSSVSPVAVNDLTRKDYVDTRDSLNVKKTGDTMTGDLTVTSGDISIRPTNSTDDARLWFKDATGVNRGLVYYDNNVNDQMALQLRDASSNVINQLVMQPDGNVSSGDFGQVITDPDHLVPKRYVDDVMKTQAANLGELLSNIDGTIDMSAELQNIIDNIGSYTHTQTLYIPKNIQIRLDSDVLLSFGTNLVGDAHGNQVTNFSKIISAGDALLSKTGGGFILLGNHLISGITFYRDGSSTTSTSLVNYAGTALFANDSVVTDILIQNSVFLGFNVAIDGATGITSSVNSRGRWTFRRISIDSWDGILLDNAQDVTYFIQVHGWPFLGNGVTGGGVGAARGTLIRIGTVYANDATKISNCHSHSYREGYVLRNSNKGAVAHSTYYYSKYASAEPEAIGILLEGIIGQVSIDGCHLNGGQYCIMVDPGDDNSSISHNVMISGTSVQNANTDLIRMYTNGSIVGCSFQVNTALDVPTPGFGVHCLGDNGIVAPIPSNISIGSCTFENIAGGIGRSTLAGEIYSSGNIFRNVTTPHVGAGITVASFTTTV